MCVDFVCANCNANCNANCVRSGMAEETPIGKPNARSPNKMMRYLRSKVCWLKQCWLEVIIPHNVGYMANGDP